MDAPQISLLSIIAAVISVIGAVVSLYKLKPEKRKLGADADSAIGDAAESIATGARVTVGMLMEVKRELEEKLKNEREASKIELKMLRAELEDERAARVRLQEELVQEKQARIQAENRMRAFQKWLNALLAQLNKAQITPAPPPFELTEEAPPTPS